MANEAIFVFGSELILETAASSASISDGGFRECDSDDRQSSDNAGYPLGVFEFSTAAGGFSTAPTAGAAIHLYEQKINSDSNDGPTVDGSYQHDLIGTFFVDVLDGQQHLSLTAPIHPAGGKYWLEWLDGGAGTASIDAGWELRLKPVTYGT